MNYNFNIYVRKIGTDIPFYPKRMFIEAVDEEQALSIGKDKFILAGYELLGHPLISTEELKIVAGDGAPK